MESKKIISQNDNKKMISIPNNSKVSCGSKKNHNLKTVLKLENVWKTYDLGEIKVSAVKGINIEVNEGEFVAVTGASGSGKSTTLNLMGALDSPTSGKIFLDGMDITDLNESKLARVRGKKIGFVFQSFNLHPSLTVYENIALAMKIHEFSDLDIEKKVNELIKLVKLEHRLDHLPRQLSGGERQRVAIARALSTDPAIILADEPTGNLDSKTGEAIMQLFVDLNKQGKTIILVTHEPDIAEYGKRQVVIFDGQVKK
ncbi:MAG: ABC transporter ATP-binding protein [Candidatus ainarchaeum sp.]|nr:ABC transporter ATP-binding protein [Candidatus ainarchaeum sp.]